MQEKIIIKGAREHNLKNINLEIPRNKMTVFTGVSGSGKSSLAFDTIFAEGQRRYIESLSAYARQFLGQMQKPDVDEISGLSPAISIDQKAHSSNPRSIVATITEIYDYLRVLFARVGVPFCPSCGSKIEKMSLDEMVDIVIKESSAAYCHKKLSATPTIFLSPVVRGRKGEYYQLLYDLYNSGFSNVRVDGSTFPLKERIELDRNKKHSIDLIVDSLSKEDFSNLDKDKKQRIAEAIETSVDYSNGLLAVCFANKKEIILSAKFSCSKCDFSFPEIEPRLFSFNSPYGACPTCHGLGTESLFSPNPCPDCLGKRLRRESLSVKIAGKNIVEIIALNIEKCIEFFLNLKLDKRRAEISSSVLKEILNRLEFMEDVGLDYLTLDRKAGTLSGGEAQRIRLASQVGSKLVGALYVLDEPTIGLHQADNDRLISTLKNLRDSGNTIIIVEHDEDTIRAADFLVDFGPGAGRLGGEVVSIGSIPAIFSDKKSLTCAYLRGDKKIAIPERRSIKKFLEVLKIRGAAENNLKNINIDIPLRRFTCITGVSGSGKSSLAYDTVFTYLSNRLNGTGLRLGKFNEIKGLEYLNKAILIDQSPIGRTPRSNPATYTGAFNHIRDLFAATPEARFRGYKSGRFSFNVKGGRCENCEGHGYLAVEMHFLPTVFVECEVCKGKRFNRETLEVHYKNKNIADVLSMTVDDSTEFFKDIPHIHDRVSVMQEVGLGYIGLGQAATTLSGGEAQRIKLSNELARFSTGRTFYLLDEPTTGLHFDDVKKLLEVLHELANRGNTVVVVEHNLDVIKTADWVIDLGPGGGDKGGAVVACGTPENIVDNSHSLTGKYLKKHLK
ncbi:MAG: ABC-ATPase UvrA [Candidatus Liptonbacteria bacterium RIFOXYD1_FULL_36_11]|uniref:UvrABC system protein A n=1 Tax=Candidatus Liptonbacteria bacterium RIFOXYD1_FULL_36_11 TaxID=1798656 RepID=A0A1G2CP72_9BACT|nr:MAG: ABC-ATPase UvrA [Candidatus Liptonbacteria bacterium RIFOXYD1_FULL_36_11]